MVWAKQYIVVAALGSKCTDLEEEIGLSLSIRAWGRRRRRLWERPPFPNSGEVMVEGGLRPSAPSSFEASENSNEGEVGRSCAMDEGESKSGVSDRMWGESFVVCVSWEVCGRASEVKETLYDM